MLFYGVIIGLIAAWATSANAETLQGRTFEIFDARRTDAPAPLILNLHGAGGSGPGHRSYSDFDAVATPYGVVVAYPSAPTPRWNDGRWDLLGDPEKAKRDDVGWLVALADNLVRRGMADPEQIYAIGYSNGGAMVRRLTCDAPDLLARASIVGTTLLIGLDCSGGKAIPTAYFMGTNDNIIPFGGRPAGWEEIIPKKSARRFRPAPKPL